MFSFWLSSNNNKTGVQGWFVPLCRIHTKEHAILAEEMFKGHLHGDPGIGTFLTARCLD